VQQQQQQQHLVLLLLQNCWEGGLQGIPFYQTQQRTALR
jgi:hypothetical protein